MASPTSNSSLMKAFSRKSLSINSCGVAYLSKLFWKSCHFGEFFEFKHEEAIRWITNLASNVYVSCTETELWNLMLQTEGARSLFWITGTSFILISLLQKVLSPSYIWPEQNSTSRESVSSLIPFSLVLFNLSMLKDPL